MRLHLPKGLLAALLAACFALPAGAEGETVTQYGWKEGAPATSTDGTSWKNITYNSDHTLSTFTDQTIALGTLGDVKITGVPGGDWYDGSSVTGTADSAWFNMTGNNRIYLSCPDISKMSNVYLNGVHFVIGTGNSSKDTSNAISSNLFLGAGAWGADSGTVHYKAVLRVNVDANISGNVTLTDSSAHISTWDGKDITFGGSLNGNGKSLSVGAESANSVINLNGTTNLGSLTVGAGVDTNGSLSAKGAAISVVIGNSAVAQLGNLTLFGDSTLTNNGSLTISGTYSGTTITNTGILTLADAAVVDVGRLTNTITETATTDAEGSAISGRVTVNGGFTLASGGTVNKDGDVGFTYNGFSYSGALDTGNLAGTISGGYYRVVDGDEVSYSAATTEANISHIEVLGTLTGVKDSSITTSIPITGNGSVAVDGVLETHVADLDQFTGTISLTGTSADNLAAIKFGNSNAHLTQVSSIRLNANSYISGWSDLDFNYNLEFNGGFLLANQGSWVGTNHLLSDSSIQVHKSANITGAFTAEAGKVLSIQASTFAEGEANPVLTFSGTVGKLDGATLQIEDGVTVAVTGRDGGNAQIAGDIVVKGGGTLKLTSADTLGYNGSNGGDYTDSITLEGSTITVDGASTKKVATLNLTATQTLTTDLILKGNTSIIGSAMNSFDGSITATGTNNIISNELKIRKNLTITVGNSADPTGSLEIAGKLGVFENFYGVLTKDGGGTLIVSGTGHDYTRAVTVNDGTLELRSAFNPVKIDLRGTDTTSGSLVIAAGGTGTVNLGSGDGNGLWMDADSTVSIRKAESETMRGGKLIFGTSTSGATISATDADADASISSSTTGQYIFSSADFSLSNAEFLFNSTGQWGASLGNSLTNVSVINKSNNLLLTVTHEGNTLRGVEATGGNIKFAANAEVAGSITIADGKSVVVNSGAALTHDGFTYDGSTIKTSNAGSALSLWDNAVVNGGTLTQKKNADVGHKIIGSTLTDVKLVNTSGLELHLESAASLSAVDIGGKLQVGANTTVSGASTVSGTVEVLAGKSLEMSGAATITGAADVGGTLSTGADSTITTLTGSGTLKTSAGSATVTDASGFTGTLESTGGTLSAGSGTSLAAIKATGGSVSLSSSAASVSVAKIDVGTDGSVSVHGNSVDFKVSVADLVVGESGSRLVSNLDVTGSLSVQVGSNGQTGGLNMAYSGTSGDFPSGTLTLGSASGTGLELNLSYLPVMTTGDSLTLFKGVYEVLYYGIISAGTGEPEATAVTLSDPAPIALTGTGIDASTVFSNVASGDFTLKFDNNIVSLVAQRAVPEPTTATLSLLALMGLAARRRRRKA
ncbi:MAG: PEP-CTERM sorting domain-containing protein [Akkermansia muciniphila]|nr:PEP-CTERM sorting domain-containing protein [Akkermansia muciniphila]